MARFTEHFLQILSLWCPKMSLRPLELLSLEKYVAGSSSSHAAQGSNRGHGVFNFVFHST
jgi:hypothetical protein